MSNPAMSTAQPLARRLPQHPGAPVGARRRGNAAGIRAATANLTHYVASTLFASGPVLFAAAVGAGLLATWLTRHEGHLTPETGAGYWLGIAGSTMMLLLLLYPIRKRVRALRVLGRVPSWFRLHMMLGIAGPSLILVHSNWTLASFNATVAMASMLVVVASGVIGRYLYGKVHLGLYGRKAAVEQILADAGLLKQALGEDLPQTGQLLEDLRQFERRILAPRRGLLSQTAAFLTLGIRCGMLRGRLMRVAERTIRHEGRRRGWSWSARRRRRALVRQTLQLYFAAVSKAARFGVYERMFALWHVLHMPLFFLLIAAAIIHILAVHLY